MEVCLLSYKLMLHYAQTLSISLQNSIRFFHFPLPASLSVFITVNLPYEHKCPKDKIQAYPVAYITLQWVRWHLYAGGSCFAYA